MKPDEMNMPVVGPETIRIMSEALANKQTIIDSLNRELAALKSHDDAPCVFCDPLRQQLAQALQDNANLRAAMNNPVTRTSESNTSNH